MVNNIKGIALEQAIERHLACSTTETLAKSAVTGKIKVSADRLTYMKA